MAEASTSTPSTSNLTEKVEEKTTKKLATSILFLGLAGSGKTSVVQRLNAYLHSKKQPPVSFSLSH